MVYANPETALALARVELEKAREEEKAAVKETILAKPGNELARQAVQLQREAEIKSQATRAAGAKDALELARRRRFVEERYGGVNTDRGKVYMHYGPPDEIEQHSIQGKTFEFWKYRDASKGKAVLEIQFEDGKQVQRKGGLTADI